MDCSWFRRHRRPLFGLDALLITTPLYDDVLLSRRMTLSRDQRKLSAPLISQQQSAPANLQSVWSFVFILASASLLSASPAETAAISYHAGVTQLQLQNFAGAIRYLQRAHRLARGSAFIHSIELQLGEAERRSGHYQAAMRYFQKVAGEDEALAAQAHAHAGQMAIEYRRYDEARALLQAQLWTNPGSEERDAALWGLGWVAFRTGDFQAARNYFAALRAESPDSNWTAAATYWQARAVAESGDELGSEALLGHLAATWPTDYYGYRAEQLVGAVANVLAAATTAATPPNDRQASVMPLVLEAASANQIDADLITAVIHQESRFNARARSPVGALGLMQLMPATARSLWREERKHQGQAYNLLDPAVNIRLGTRLLARLVRSFSHQDEYALATYNAGTTAVMRWRTRQGELPTDIFVEEIPYAETRAYVKKVLAHRQLCKHIH